MGLISTLFSFRGRTNRRALWATIVLFGAMMTAILYLQITLHPDAPYTISKDGELLVNMNGRIAWLAAAYMFIAFWSLLALMVKRAHDHNHSGAFLLLFLVPLLNLWPTFEIYLLRDTIGDNRYGPDPLTGPAQSWKSALVLIGMLFVYAAQSFVVNQWASNMRAHPPQIEAPSAAGSDAKAI